MTSNNLDMSWINEYSRIHSVQQLMNREPIDDIVIQTIYMNHTLEIKKINKELISLTNINGNRGITKEQLMNIVQDKTNILHGKYKLFDCVIYTIDLYPKEIQKYINSDSNNIGKLKSISMENDIIIRPSLFIFHSLHSIFILLQETVEPIMKSIIKNTGQLSDRHKHTKKVRITEPIQNRKPGKMNKTRKHQEK